MDQWQNAYSATTLLRSHMMSAGELRAADSFWISLPKSGSHHVFWPERIPRTRKTPTSGGMRSLGQRHAGPFFGELGRLNSAISLSELLTQISSKNAVMVSGSSGKKASLRSNSNSWPCAGSWWSAKMSSLPDRTCWVQRFFSWCLGLGLTTEKAICQCHCFENLPTTHLHTSADRQRLALEERSGHLGICWSVIVSCGWVENRSQYALSICLTLPIFVNVVPSFVPVTSCHSAPVKSTLRGKCHGNSSSPKDSAHHMTCFNHSTSLFFASSTRRFRLVLAA